jgi:asparagine synthase (glutamine-hydrolysing)
VCGIAGIVNGDPMKVADMVFAMSHRGPDFSECRYVGGGVALGHARLAIIDTSPAGNQPMQFGKWWITYNGEVYNYRELRAHLETKGHTFKTQTDTEVLLHMWAEYGADCLHSLDGQFAFGIYDTEKKELTLVRDRAGEKPLYWGRWNGVFGFASELRALASVPGVEREFCPQAASLYALYRYVPAPRTIWKSVNKLQPGHLLTVRADRSAGNSPTVKRWWSWEVEPTHEVTQKGFMDACDAIDACLEGSVRRRLIADVPLGLFLSGGIDSSLTAAVAGRLGHVVKTFSIGFEGADSEHGQARLIANHLGTDHHEHVFGPADFESVGRTIGDRMDEPNGDRSCVPTYLLAGFAKQHVTVALSGDGGDELFGGYSRYLGWYTSKENDTPAEEWPILYYDNLLPVYGTALANDVRSELFSAHALFQTHEPLHALRALDFNRYLPGCVLSKMDRMSMQHSLEVRTPFLEPHLMDIARKLPSQYLMNSKMAKLVLREIAAKYLPREIALAPKRGFGMPKGVFAQNSRVITEMYEEATPHCERVGFPKPPNNFNAIWAYCVLGNWLRSVA